MKKRIILLSLILSLSFATLCRMSAQESSTTFNISKSLSFFNAVLRELDMYYVDTLQHEKMVESAINYMLHNIDPYTVYIPESEEEDIAIMTSGEYGGIGAIITKTEDGITISEPYEGMPAQKNGVKAGDIILEIDGEKTDKLSVADASSKLKGTPSTEINLKLQRQGIKKPITKKFLREKIHIPAISYAEVIAPKIGFIILNDFTEQASLDVKNTILEMQSKHQIESLILDLRDNGGGLIDEAVKIMGYFVPKGTEIVSTKGKNSQASNTFRTTLEPIFPDMQLVVLINNSSASASEILAGAVQDLDRGLLVGERTFGKGLVQNIRSVGYGGYLKVTTSKYYIPSGRCIQAIDYAKRNEGERMQRIPDSLTNVFKTKNGRVVRDGGGIVPDTITVEDSKINIAYYLYGSNLYFSYATQYAAKHPQIAPPMEFKLTDDDFTDFVQYLKDKGFTYEPKTIEFFDNMYEVAKYEGLEADAKAELEALKAKLFPDLDTKLAEHKKDVMMLLEAEIIKRYYYQKGVIAYSLKDDRDIKTAVDLLNNKEKFNTLLHKGL